MINRFVKRTKQGSSAFPLVVVHALAVLILALAFSACCRMAPHCDEACNVKIHIIDDGSQGVSCGYLTTATFRDSTTQYFRDNGPHKSTSNERLVPLSPCIPDYKIENDTYLKEFAKFSEIVVQACYENVDCPGVGRGRLVTLFLRSQQLFDSFGFDDADCNLLVAHDIRSGSLEQGCFDCCAP